MKMHDWLLIPKEQLNPLIARQVIHSGNMTVAKIFLKKGATVPLHVHENEQITILVEGSLKFHYPDREQIVEAGQILETAPNIPHSVDALEDSIAIDLFAPRREDWIRGDDAYLRK
jgi:quercetin dioxygenase-like cupin family protein